MNYLPFSHWHWLGVAAILLIVEVLFSGSGFLLWMGLAALLMTALSWVFPALSWGWQMILFSICAVLTSFGWWAYLKKNPLKTDRPRLNQRSEQYVGRIFTLIAPIENGRGKIHVDDSTWTVAGPDLPLGTRVQIIRAEGTILIAIAVSDTEQKK